ncbi:hypothetical protein FB451DRAFT_1558427 [Mycena latifolia]|nr:hypothetical protein FB451DRAFT_1558427 [Mycena latifolia]
MYILSAPKSACLTLLLLLAAPALASGFSIQCVKDASGACLAGAIPNHVPTPADA